MKKKKMGWEKDMSSLYLKALTDIRRYRNCQVKNCALLRPLATASQ